MGGLFVSEDGGATWRAANGALLAASSDFGKGESWGDAEGLAARRWVRSRRRPVTGSWRTPVSAALKRAADGPKFNGIAKTVDGGRTWTIVHEEADRPSANLEGSWIEVRAPERRVLDLVRRALRPGGGSDQPRHLLRDRPLPDLSHRRTAASAGRR